MHDIIFCSLPYSNLDHIYSAPAILKGAAVSNGFTAKTVDFGCELLNQCNRNTDQFDRVQSYIRYTAADQWLFGLGSTFGTIEFGTFV
jgi:hypothetical protein